MDAASFAYPVISEPKLAKLKNNSPWEFINTNLKKAGLDFEVVEPNFEFISVNSSYTLQLKKKRNSVMVPVAGLSTGEKVIFAAMVAEYNSQFYDNKSIKLILFDETDAGLDSDMVAKFIKYLENAFTNRGKGVVMTTHSPTTVALSPSGSLHRMTASGDMHTLKKITISQGLITLSNGYVAVTKEDDETSKIEYLVRHIDRPVLFVEGSSDKSMIENAWKKLTSDDLPFFIVDADNAEKVRDRLNTFVTSSHEEKSVIGLFDFDGAGIKAYDQAMKKNAGTGKGDLSSGFYRQMIRPNGQKVTAMLLPTPTERESFIFADRKKSDMQTEKLLSDKILEQHAIPVKYGEGSKKTSNGTKSDISEDCPDYDAEEFKYFRPLLRSVCTHTNIVIPDALKGGKTN